MEKLIAKTRSGQEIVITPVHKEDKEGVEYRAHYDENEITLSNTNFQKIEGKFCLHLDHYQVKRLLGIDFPKDKKAAIAITEPDAEKIVREQWPNNHRNFISDLVEKQVAAMSNDDVITLYAYSGYGMHYSLSSDKLSYLASNRVARRVKQIMDMFENQPAPEKNSDVAYKVELTWGEYQRINKEIDDKESADKAQKEVARQAKFDEAKETCKPVLLYKNIVEEEDLPRKYREEESSLATVYVYAMPDGSTKQEITHAY